MMKRFLWPATVVAAFALPAACGGGSTDSGDMGGEGGQDGDSGGSGGGNNTGGSSTGGDSTDGGAGEGGMAGSGSGGGPIVVQPETCSDGDQNETETDVDCGGPDCDPCGDDDACQQPSDCQSSVCNNQVCAAPECGDRVKNGDEECDDGGESLGCDDDCTLVECGDGHLNVVAEMCEPDPDLDVWQRCGPTCIHGADLDGTWRTSNLPATDSPWEVLTPASYFYYGPFTPGLQSYQHVGQAAIHDLSQNAIYDVKNDQWSLLPNPAPFLVFPYGSTAWESGAVDSDAIWVPRGQAMHRFVIADQVWEDPIPDLPDGSANQGSGAVFDGDGFIWYVGNDPDLGISVLVRFDPLTSEYDVFDWTATVTYDMGSGPRLIYDPITNQILAAPRGSTGFLVFDLTDETFHLGATLPAGSISLNTCGDRAGGVYLIPNGTEAQRYDVATDTFVPLGIPMLGADDNGSTCMVSELGYLYYGSAAFGSAGGFFRLRLNRR